MLALYSVRIVAQHVHALDDMTWGGRQTIAALVALTATFVGFSGLLGERFSFPLIGFGLLVALTLGGRAPRSLRGDQ